MGPISIRNSAESSTWRRLICHFCSYWLDRSCVTDTALPKRRSKSWCSELLRMTFRQNIPYGGALVCFLNWQCTSISSNQFTAATLFAKSVSLPQGDRGWHRNVVTVGWLSLEAPKCQLVWLLCHWEVTYRIAQLSCTINHCNITEYGIKALSYSVSLLCS